MIGVVRERLAAAPLRSGIGTFLNPHSYLIMRNHPQLLRRFDAVYLDGFALVHAMRIAGEPSVERNSMDLTGFGTAVLEQAHHAKVRIAVVGGLAGEAEAAVGRLEAHLGTLNVVMMRDGYFESSEWDAEVSSVVRANPELLLVGMGTPRQEQFLADVAASGWRGVGYTCGAFLSQTAGSSQGRYYPKAIDRWNLRWLYRLAREPRLASRYLIRYPWFLVVFAMDLLRERRSARAT